MVKQENKQRQASLFLEFKKLLEVVSCVSRWNTENSARETLTQVDSGEVSHNFPEQEAAWWCSDGSTLATAAKITFSLITATAFRYLITARALNFSHLDSW